MPNINSGSAGIRRMTANTGSASVLRKAGANTGSAGVPRSPQRVHPVQNKKP